MKPVIPRAPILELYIQVYHFYEHCSVAQSVAQRKVIVSGIDSLLSSFLRRIPEQIGASASGHQICPSENMK
jgi:hypothetical protein